LLPQAEAETEGRSDKDKCIFSKRFPFDFAQGAARAFGRAEWDFLHS
jgi:hypothetical protein